MNTKLWKYYYKSNYFNLMWSYQNNPAVFRVCLKWRHELIINNRVCRKNRPIMWWSDAADTPTHTHARVRVVKVQITKTEHAPAPSYDAWKLKASTRRAGARGRTAAVGVHVWGRTAEHPCPLSAPRPGPALFRPRALTGCWEDDGGCSSDSPGGGAARRRHESTGGGRSGGPVPGGDPEALQPAHQRGAGVGGVLSVLPDSGGGAPGRAELRRRRSITRGGPVEDLRTGRCSDREGRRGEAGSSRLRR